MRAASTPAPRSPYRSPSRPAALKSGPGLEQTRAMRRRWRQKANKAEGKGNTAAAMEFRAKATAVPPNTPKAHREPLPRKPPPAPKRHVQFDSKVQVHKSVAEDRSRAGAKKE
eukprot:6481014-Amphidinium_carterae.1